ncbi:DUF542 domain-containing protein [Tenacibaculum maritimum]
MKRTVADYVTENIKTAHIFNKYGIHFCCKGEVTIQEACSERNINVMDLEKELLTVDRVSDLIEDYNKWELNFLMIYLKMYTMYVLEKTYTYYLKLLQKYWRHPGLFIGN